MERLGDCLDVVAGLDAQRGHARPGPAVGVTMQRDGQKDAQPRTLEVVQVSAQRHGDLEIHGVLALLAQPSAATVEDLDHDTLLPCAEKVTADARRYTPMGKK